MQCCTWRSVVRRRIALLGCLIVATACSGGGGSSEVAPGPALAANADISLFFMGNSHTDYHDVPGMVADYVRAARPGRTVLAEQAPNYLFLEERLQDPATQARLNSRRWSAVILQAQKYSSSGQFTYSTTEAVELVRKARAQQALPVMFPEWPRLGIAETQRIYDLHVSIARVEPACVAPIGQAWDLAAARHPGLALHDPDGNHSRPPGAMLAAMVIANTLTGASPRTFPTLGQRAVSAETQEQLRVIAADTVAMHPPRQHCPADQPLN